MKDLDAKFARMRSEVDRDKVTDSMRKEALGPTRDAIKVCIQLRVHTLLISYIIWTTRSSIFDFVLLQDIKSAQDVLFKGLICIRMPKVITVKWSSHCRSRSGVSNGLLCRKPILFQKQDARGIALSAE